MGIMVGISIPSYGSYINKAKVMQSIMSVNEFKVKALEYYIENGSFPDNAKNVFSGKNNLAFKKGPIKSINYKQSGGLPAFYVELSKPFEGDKKYVYIWAMVENDFIRWFCGANGMDNSVSDIYYPNSCKN